MPMHDFAKPKPLISTSTSDSSPNKPAEASGPNPNDSLYDVEVGPVDGKYHIVLPTVSDMFYYFLRFVLLATHSMFYRVFLS